MKAKLFIILAFLFLLVGPVLLFYVQETETLDVLIYNNTVTDGSYREHASISWLLNHHGYRKSNQARYDEGVDYFGVFIDGEKQDITYHPIDRSEKKYGLMYIADTYGVYEEDIPWRLNHQHTVESPPTLIQGGMQEEDWSEIKRQVNQNQTDLIMEFNSFASPTSSVVREDILQFMKMSWDGWIGRQFSSLSKEDDEVPPWIISRYESQNERWEYVGEGIILINDFSEEVIVLSLNDDELLSSEVRVHFTYKGEDFFGLDESPPYPYWFDIVTPHSQEQVFATYTLPVNQKGEEILKEHQIPVHFPAVLHHEKNGASVYYFAGDYADTTDLPWFDQYFGLAKIKEWLSFESIYSETSFFWRMYNPMMKVILKETMKQDEVAADTSNVEQAMVDGVKYSARINEQHFEVFKNNKWEPLTIKGVNMGMAKPGYFPGEASISYEEYREWFQQIADMNANTIRVYTLHPPHFYEALYNHNMESDEPLYVLHGVWIDEEPLEETLDAFNEESTKAFQQEIMKIVDVIHGDASLPYQAGHSHGDYHYDVSPYIIGWVIGIEWYPLMVDNMAQTYQELGDYQGSYVYTKEADPMEFWIAEQFDFLMEYELSEYKTMRPLSFTNWVTTDNLKQKAEPSDQEDLAQVDPNHIYVNDALSAGMFASYHVYPYYPDFLNLEEKYINYIDHRGNKNNYAGYLKDLNESHDLPILIAEFGVPASRGLTHKNPFGWNQGFISEQEQGEINLSLFEDILEQDMLGGLIFTWQDEWFKRTWNTMDYDNPNRRPYWSNAQTNEQQFGLLSFDRHKVRINGKEDDWKDGTILYTKEDGPLRSLSVDHDERYIYLKTTFEDLYASFFEDHTLELFISVREDAGIHVANDTFDFRISIKGQENSRIEVAGDYDTFFYDYVERLGLLDVTPEQMADKEHSFHPLYLALNKELTRPDTKEILPFDYYETGELLFGIGDPDHPEYHSLADYYYAEETDLLEIRIPWMLLNAKDPSQKEFMGEMWQGGIESSITIDGLGMYAQITKDKEVIDSFKTETKKYKWDSWDLPEHQPRLKQSYYLIQDYFEHVDK